MPDACAGRPGRNILWTLKFGSRETRRALPFDELGGAFFFYVDRQTGDADNGFAVMLPPGTPWVPKWLARPLSPGSARDFTGRTTLYELVAV